MKTFTELKNAQSVVIAYDGLNPLPAYVLLSEAVLQQPQQILFPATRGGPEL